MCGIAGIFLPAPEDFEAEAELAPVLSRLSRRGPDGQGISHGHGWAFGHRRLAVIDLQGGRQPLEDAAGFVLSYNGELYNYRELGAELRADGHVFTTASDTEVVLKAWMAWGPDCLKKFNGMFAFAIYDPGRDSVFLVRDHLGVKPLFYSVNQQGLYFASSMAALLAFKNVPAVADPVGISHYLSTTKVVMGSRTMVKGVSCLEPGTWLEIQRGCTKRPTREVRYWRLPAQQPDAEVVSFREAVEQTRELVRDSVAYRLISDVPVGGFLSGGIDSTIIASQACPLSGHRFNAYSVGYDNESVLGKSSYHEWPYIREAAACYGMHCNEIVLQASDYPGDWQFLIAEKGLPLSTPNEVGIYRLAKALRHDFTVALSGEGADEIFGGYTEAYFSVKDFERSQQANRLSADERQRFGKALQRMYGTDHFLSLPDHFFRVTSWMNFGLKFELLQPGWREILKQDDAMVQHYLERFDALKHCTPFDSYLRLLLEKNLENLLFRLDSSTMAASVEGRVPFTDSRVVSLLFSLPDRYKMDWRDQASETEARTLNITEAEERELISSKILLRTAFADVVPERILHRRKMSFPVPFREWFGGSLRNMVESRLRENPWARDWLRPQSVNLLLDKLNEPAYAMLVWPLLNLCLWQEAMGISWDECVI